MAAFRQGLSETGWVEGQNLKIEYRWAEFHYDRLPGLAADLVSHKVDVIAAVGGADEAFLAKNATSTIPVVFITGDDPIRLEYVTNLARPEGNLTGVSFFNAELAAKRVALLRELVPAAARVAVLLNPIYSPEATLKDLERPARAMGMQLQVLNASNSREINAAFASFVRERPDALYVGTSPFFISRRVQLTQLAPRHAVPAIYSVRQYTEAGGLMSYGTSQTDAWRQMGVYTGHILKGAKPADLPVIQSTRFELIINAETARMLGLTVPDKLLSLADEVIE